ncbi:MAG: deoxyribose-phosphate aldolase [Desulfobacterales bacterium]|jgi:deoxyribose-phosphate aldolase
MKADSVAEMTAPKMAQFIDHTLLKPEADRAAMDKLCEEAISFGFKAVCINSGWVSYVVKKLERTNIAVCSVIGFPLGAMSVAAKAFEARQAVGEGAQELDMVLNIGAMKSGDYEALVQDIRAVRLEAGPPVILKVIIETCLLTIDEKIKACEIAQNTGADFVKTSTGFSTSGATPEDVILMRKTVGPKMGVKASGGIKDFETAAAMIAAGATRIGAGAGVAIVNGAEKLP